MLVELVVENYAVVDRVRVRFHPGLNLLTGETGSGKSIVVDALGLLWGGRSSGDVVRAGARQARVSGIFEIPSSGVLAALLDSAGVETEEGELLLAREVQAGGKSRAFAGGRPVTVNLLRELAPFLGDIHGQHDQQRLFAADAQLEMLDQSGGHEEILAEVETAYREWRAAGAELAALEASEQERLRLADLWEFQRKEIEQAAPEPGEDVRLDNERRVLRHISLLEESVQGAYVALYDGETSAAVRMREALRRLEDAGRYDETLAPVRQALEPAAITVGEAAHELRHYLGRLEADPRRLEEVESRLAALEKLKRKYGSSIEEILAFLHDVRSKLEGIEKAEDRRRELGLRRDAMAASYERAAGILSARRSEAARRFEQRVEEELQSLAMERTAFHIQTEPAAWSASGMDRVRYLVSPNPGEPPKPLDKIASGGELSRIALALRTCLAVAPRSRDAARAGAGTLVFDEVDAGVGGSAAETVGRRLKQISVGGQVLCVTHLPQIAGFADHHYRVEKKEVNGRTVAAVVELDAAGRVQEIARMLSGQQLTEEAVRHAEQLIKLASVPPSAGD
jgi:DNA repair protein RecN (Recombination protein N)